MLNRIKYNLFLFVWLGVFAGLFYFFGPKALIAVFLVIGTSIIYVRKRGRSLPFVNTVIANRYFSLKYLATKKENEVKLAAGGLVSVGIFGLFFKRIRLFFLKNYLSCLYYILSVFASKEDSFRIVQEDFKQKRGHEIFVKHIIDNQEVRISYRNFEEMVKAGNLPDSNLIANFQEKIADAHQLEHEEIGKMSFWAFATLIVISVITGLITSFVAPSFWQKAQ